jgi:hypothetical protein
MALIAREGITRNGATTAALRRLVWLDFAIGLANSATHVLFTKLP